MGSGGESTSFSSIPDWDWEHIDPQEIEAAFSLAESLSAKRPRTFFNGPLPDSKSNSRRLPVWASPPAHSRDRDREIITPKDNDSALSTSSFVPSPCRCELGFPFSFLFSSWKSLLLYFGFLGYFETWHSFYFTTKKSPKFFFHV